MLSYVVSLKLCRSFCLGWSTFNLGEVFEIEPKHWLANISFKINQTNQQAENPKQITNTLIIS